MFCGSSQAEVELDLNPLQAELELSTQRLAPGALIPLQIHLELKEGFYVYDTSLEVKGSYPPGLQVDDLEISPLVEFHDSVSQSNKMGVQNTGVIKTVLQIPDDASPARGELHLRLRYQACTPTYCLFPKWLDLTTPVSWVAAEDFYTSSTEVAEPVRARLLSQDWRNIQSAFQENFLLTLGLIFIFGFLTSLTPCVYPMIPITLAVLGVQGGEKRFLSRVALSMSYVLGVSTIYTTLGVFAALTGALFGSYLGHPLVVTVLAVVFIYLGLASWGLFSFDLTRLFQQLKAPNSKGLLQSYVTGIFAGFLASPCVGPVLFGLLTYIGQSRDVGLGALSLLIYSLGFGVLFLALGIFSGLRKYIPSSGPWMEWVNKAFGLLFLGLAVYYLSPLLERSWVLLLAGALLILLAATLRKPSDQAPLMRQLFRTFVVMLFFGLGVGCLVVATQLFFKPTELQLDPSGLTPYEESQMEAATAQGLPIVIDFYADWCYACVELNTKVFPAPEVQDRLSQMAVFKVDLTTNPSQHKDLMERFGVQTLPTLVFIDSQGQWQEDLTLRQFEDPKSFARRLDQLLGQTP